MPYSTVCQHHSHTELISLIFPPTIPQTQVSLDLEIAAYDKLLCGEELRLNIQPSTTAATASQMSASFNRSGRSTPGGGATGGYGASAAKRKRTFAEATTGLETFEHVERSHSDFAISTTAKGDIEIVEVCPEGRSLRVRNKSDREAAIGGWRLIATGPSGAETLFKFHRSVRVEAGATVTVWSMDAGAAHEPPANIVMKQQRWQTAGDGELQVRLLNDTGAEVATLERTRQRLTQRASRLRDHSLGGKSASAAGAATNGEDLYHQQGDPQAPEKCTIM